VAGLAAWVLVSVLAPAGPATPPHDPAGQGEAAAPRDDGPGTPPPAPAPVRPDGLLLLYAFGEGHEDLAPAAGSLIPGEAGAGKLRLRPEGPVEYEPDAIRVYDGARLVSEAAGRLLAERIRRSGSFTVETIAAPADEKHMGPARVVSLSLDGGNRNFTLAQGKSPSEAGRVWAVRVRTERTGPNGTSPQLFVEGLRARRTHVTVVYDGRSARAYLDGVLAAESEEVSGSLSDWDESYALCLANEWKDKRDWAGRVELVAFYDRALPPEDVRRLAALPRPGAPAAAAPRAPTSPGGRRSPAPWRVPDAEWRQIVDLALVTAREPRKEHLPLGAPPVPASARALVWLPADAGEAGLVRLFDSEGRELGYRLGPAPGEGVYELVSETPEGGGTAPYEVYYPAKSPVPGPPGPAREAEGGVSLAAFAVGHERAGELRDLGSLVAAVKKGKSLGSLSRPRIDDCVGPFGRHDDYVAVYQGRLACPVDGLYSFGIDADDRAWLLIDGDAIMSGGRPGKLPRSPFPYRMSKRLSAGLHALTFYHLQGKGALRARLAWKPPDRKTMRLIPPSAFATHLPACAVALERKGRDAPEVFFSAERRARLLVNRTVAVEEWELTASGPVDAADVDEAPAAGAGETSSGIAFRESGGICVMEAEHYSSIAPRGDSVSWSFDRARPGYGGRGYLWIPEGESDERPSWDRVCEASYRVLISTPGTYHVAWRHRSPGSGSNSVWTGLDGEDRSEDVGFHMKESNDWTWQRGSGPLGRLAPGVHTVHLRRREDGFQIDRLMVAVDARRLPPDGSAGLGPSESARAPAPPTLARRSLPAGRQGSGRARVRRGEGARPSEPGDEGPAKAGTRWVWREGDSVLGRGRRLTLFVSGLDDADAGLKVSREVALSLEGPEGEAGRYARTIAASPPDPLEGVPLSLRLEVASAPTYLYPHEPFEVHLRAINDSEEAVELEAVERRFPGLRGGPGFEDRSLGEFALPPVGTPGSDVLSRRMFRIARRFEEGEATGLGRLVYLLGPPGAPAIALRLELVSSRAESLPGLRAGRGALFDRNGSRLVLVLPYDTESSHRRWAMFRAILGGGGEPGKVLLFGEDLASPGAEGGEGLVPRLSRLLGPDAAVEGAAFPEGSYPVHAASAGADREFGRKPWGRIWISSGLADCRAGTPLVDFRRGIDFLIDRARAAAPGARLVVLGPTPEWGRLDVSRRYAEAARAVAAQHHVPYVDLHGLVESMMTPEDPSAPFREPGPDDGVRFPYPLGEAMDAIAREVVRR
jgi:hypothetical protein